MQFNIPENKLADELRKLKGENARKQLEAQKILASDKEIQ